jgi:hypothetical protein
VSWSQPHRFRDFCTQVWENVGRDSPDGTEREHYTGKGEKRCKLPVFLARHLSDEFDHRDGCQVHFVTRVYSRKVFAILVFIGMVDEDVIQVFKKHDFDDGYLPIGYDYAKKAVKCINEKSNYTVLEGFRECSRWNTVTMSAFCDAQWQFIAPVFAMKPKRIEYPIYNETPLPFVWRSEKSTGKGTLGLVYQARIHRAHLRLITQEACPSTIPCLSFWLILFRRMHIRKSFHQR